MGTLPLEFFELLPCFIKRLTFHLREESDVTPKFGSLLRREILAQERLRETIPSSEWIGIPVQKPRLGFILQRERKYLNRIAPLQTLFIFSMPHFSKKETIGVLGFSIGYPPNCFCWNKVMNDGLNLKLFASIRGLTMLDGMAFGSGITKSLNGVVVGSMMASWVCFPCPLWFLAHPLRARKIALILGTKGAKSPEPWLLLCMQQEVLPKEGNQLEKE